MYITWKNKMRLNGKVKCSDSLILQWCLLHEINSELVVKALTSTDLLPGRLRLTLINLHTTISQTIPIYPGHW